MQAGIPPMICRPFSVHIDTDKPNQCLSIGFCQKYILILWIMGNYLFYCLQGTMEEKIYERQVA